MAEAALRPMTVSEFLRWDSGDDRRYELVDGAPLAMAPPSAAHAVVTNHLGRLLGVALAGSGCLVLSGAGVAAGEQDDRVFIPDLVVSCRRHRGDEALVLDPQVIVEVLSPSTESYDRRTKLPAYRAIGSVREIVPLDSVSRFAEVHRREAGDVWRVDLLRFADEVIELPSLGVALALGPLYEGLDLAEGLDREAAADDAARGAS